MPQFAELFTNKTNICVLCIRLLTAKPYASDLIKWNNGSVFNTNIPNSYYTFQRDFRNLLLYTSPTVFNFVCSLFDLFYKLFPLYYKTSNPLKYLLSAYMKRIRNLPWLPVCDKQCNIGY